MTYVLCFLTIKKPLIQFLIVTCYFKLETLGVNSYVIRWLTHYLCKRYQYICINGKFQQITCDIRCTSWLCSGAYTVYHLH